MRSCLVVTAAQYWEKNSVVRFSICILKSRKDSPHSAHFKHAKEHTYLREEK